MTATRAPSKGTPASATYHAQKYPGPCKTGHVARPMCNRASIKPAPVAAGRSSRRQYPYRPATSRDTRPTSRYAELDTSGWTDETWMTRTAPSEEELRRAANARLRVLQHLPDDGDLSLIVLKGHLLIEELLVTLVCAHVKHAEAIDSGVHSPTRRSRAGSHPLPALRPQSLAKASDFPSFTVTGVAGQLRFVLFSPDQTRDASRKPRPIFGDDMLDFIWTCPRPAVPRSECATDYHVELGGDQFNEAVAYFEDT